jgi:hypothetical protein
VEYLNGNKDAALKELREAQTGRPNFQKDFEAMLRDSPELKSLREDREFLAALRGTQSP